MSLPKPNSQTTVAIGASSGIGTELARGLARRGFPLLLVARRSEHLDELANDVGQEYSVGVEVMPWTSAPRRPAANWPTGCTRNRLPVVQGPAGLGASGVFHELPVERESRKRSRSMRWC